VKTDYDSRWKDILESYFQSALELCFPQIARQGIPEDRPPLGAWPAQRGRIGSGVVGGWP
jgi:hypothetical protein